MKKTVLNAFYYHGRDLVSDIRPVNAVSMDGIFSRSNPGREEEKRILSARKYYRVTAKCGHVGRDRFLKGEFYVRAEDKKEAAAKARLFPRVKHDHKDAILNVEEVTCDEFMEGEAERAACPYWTCKSRSEQEKFMEDIEELICPETGTRPVDRKNGFRKKEKSGRKAYKRPGQIALSAYESYYDETREA